MGPSAHAAQGNSLRQHPESPASFPDDTPGISSRIDLKRFDLDELVRLARLGQRAAFDELVRRTYRETYTLALRLLSDPDDARDVTQETYLRAYRGLDRFRGDANIRTWLYRITANTSSSHLRRRFRHRHESLDDGLVVIDENVAHDPQRSHEFTELRADLLRALAKLPPRLRAVVVLRDVYDLPHQQIAVELGISESAAKVRLHRARRKLRDELIAGSQTREIGADLTGVVSDAV